MISIVGFSQKAKEEAALKEMVSKKFTWMINKNYDSLESILHDRVTYIHSNGWSQNKTEMIEDLRSGKLLLEDVQIQALAVKIGNQTALVNGQGKFVGAVNGVPFSVDLIFTEGYVKESSTWRLISRLATKVSQ
jgi:hypothetical protein